MLFSNKHLFAPDFPNKFCRKITVQGIFYSEISIDQTILEEIDFGTCWKEKKYEQLIERKKRLFLSAENSERKL
jgi:hypothetical protein